MSALATVTSGRARADAVARLGDAVAEFADAIESIAEPSLTGGEWGPRETLCHLVYWHETYVGITRDLNRGCEPKLRIGSFKELNRQSVIELGHEPVPALLDRLRRAQRRLAIELMGLRSTARIRIRYGSKPWGPVEFPTRIAGHIRGHQRDLRRYLVPVTPPSITRPVAIMNRDSSEAR